MESEKISVIIPAYQVEEYLGRCLDSVLKQTYDDLEIIIVDDGSFDCSGDIADRYAEKDLRVKVIHQDNRGQSAARNTGIKIATGTLITFVDADDWISENYIEELYLNLKYYDSDISSCCYYRDDGNHKKKYIFQESKEKVLLNRIETLQFLLWDAIPNYVWGRLYKSELFHDVHFPVGEIWEDLDVLWRLVMKANKISFVFKPLYNYWNNPNGSCSSAGVKQYIFFFEKIKGRYMHLKDISDLGRYAEFSLTRGYRMEVVHFRQATPEERKIIAGHRKWMLQEIHRRDIYPLMSLKQILMLELGLLCPDIAAILYR